MKKMCLMMALLVCFFVQAAAVSAEDIHSVGGDKLADAVPPQQQKYLEGISVTDETSISAFFERFADNVSSDGREIVAGTLKSFGKVLLIIILTAAARGIASAADSSPANTVIDMAGIIACAAVLTTDFTSILRLCTQTFDQISLFSATLQPVLAGVLSVGGHAATASMLQIATMVVFDVVIRIIKTLFVPAVCTYLSIVTINAATGNEMMHEFAEGIKSFTSGALKLLLTIFTAYITIAGGVSGSVDRMTLRTAKFAVSGAVPVVGGIISDATETVLTGAAFLKNAVGVFGMVCVSAICALPFLRAGASYLCYRTGAAIVSPLCSKNMTGMLSGIGSGFGMLLGMLSTCSIILYLELVYVVAMVKAI